MSNAFIGTLFVGENSQHAGSILEQRTVEKSSDPGDNGSLLGLAVFRQEDFRKADQRLWIDGQRQVVHTGSGKLRRAAREVHLRQVDGKRPSR